MGIFIGEMERGIRIRNEKRINFVATQIQSGGTRVETAFAMNGRLQRMGDCDFATMLSTLLAASMQIVGNPSIRLNCQMATTKRK